MLLVVDDTVNKTFNLKTLNIKKWRLQTSYSLAVLILPQSIAMTAWYCLLRLAKNQYIVVTITDNVLHSLAKSAFS